MKRLAVFILGLVLSVSFIGCTRYRLTAPEGFAEVKRQGAGTFLAVSPEGVQMSIKTRRNYPKQDLQYWQTAMREHMLEAGYQLIAGPAGFETEKRQGVYFEWGAPYQGKDCIYLTGLVVSGRRLLVIEAGGEVTDFNRHREEIINSLKNMSTF